MPGGPGNGVCKEKLNEQGQVSLQQRRCDHNNSTPVPNKVYLENFLRCLWSGFCPSLHCACKCTWKKQSRTFILCYIFLPQNEPENKFPLKFFVLLYNIWNQKCPSKNPLVYQISYKICNICTNMTWGYLDLIFLFYKTHYNY